MDVNVTYNVRVRQHRIRSWIFRQLFCAAAIAGRKIVTIEFPDKSVHIGVDLSISGELPTMTSFHRGTWTRSAALLLLVTALLLPSGFAQLAPAGMYTPVTAESIQGAAAGSKLHDGQVCFIPVDPTTKTPIPFSIAGRALALPFPTSCALVADGKLAAIQVADSNVTDPQNVAYLMQVTDNETGNRYELGPTQISCTMTPTPANCTNGVWSMDGYDQSSVALPLTQASGSITGVTAGTGLTGGGTTGNVTLALQNTAAIVNGVSCALGASCTVTDDTALHDAAAFDPAGSAAAAQTAAVAAIPVPASGNPAMDGSAAPGSSAVYARADHVHPSDNSRASASTTVNGHPLTSDVTVTPSDVGNTTAQWNANAIADSAIGTAGALASLQALPRPFLRQWTWLYGRSGVSIGMDSFAISGSLTQFSNTTARPSYGLYLSAASAGALAGVIGTGNTRWGKNSYAFARLAPQASPVAGSLYWYGLTDASSTLSSATPTQANAALFRYIPGTDATWQCWLSNGSAYSLSDSGVMVDSASFVSLEVIEAASAVTYRINGVQVCQSINQSNRPTSTANALKTIAVVNTGAATTAQSIQIATVFHEWDTY